MLDVLVIAPHPDDAELGAGGAILKLKAEGRRGAGGPGSPNLGGAAVGGYVTLALASCRLRRPRFGEPGLPIDSCQRGAKGD
jgi:hypothetical protein